MIYSEPLSPSAATARARKLGRLSFAWGPRFFVALLLGFVALGPAWWFRQAIVAMFLWDGIVLATRQEQCHPTKTWPRSLGETTMRDPALRTPAAAPRKTGDPMQRKVFPTSARAQLPQRGLEVPNKSFRNLDCGENFGDHPVGIQPFQICFGLQENAVAQNRQGGRLDVVGNGEIAAFHARQGSGNEKQADRDTPAGPQRQRGQITSAPHQRYDIGPQRRLNAYAANVLPRRRQQSLIHWNNRNEIESSRIKSLFIAAEDFGFLLGGWIIKPDFQKEAVELRFGKRIRAFEFDGVFRCKHGKVLAKRIN